MIILSSLCPAASTKHTTVHVCSQVCYFCKNCLTVFDCFIFLLIHLHYFSLNTFNRLLFCFPVGFFVVVVLIFLFLVLLKLVSF